MHQIGTQKSSTSAFAGPRQAVKINRGLLVYGFWFKGDMARTTERFVGLDTGVEIEEGRGLPTGILTEPTSWSGLDEWEVLEDDEDGEASSDLSESFSDPASSAWVLFESRSF